MNEDLEYIQNHHSDWKWAVLTKKQTQTIFNWNFENYHKSEINAYQMIEQWKTLKENENLDFMVVKISFSNPLKSLIEEPSQRLLTI